MIYMEHLSVSEKIIIYSLFIYPALDNKDKPNLNSTW